MGHYVQIGTLPEQTVKEKEMKRALASAVLLFSLPFSAYAVILVPEPEILPLLIVGAVVGLAMSIGRRKK
jgi:hypothetical protein